MGDYTSRLLILVDGHPINDVLSGQGFVGRDFDVDLGQRRADRGGAGARRGGATGAGPC